MEALGKTGRGAGVGVGDQWVNREMGAGRLRDFHVSMSLPVIRVHFKQFHLATRMALMLVWPHKSLPVPLLSKL